MVVVMEANAPAEAVEAVVSFLIKVGCDVHRSSGQTRVLLGVVGSGTGLDPAVIAEMPGVARVVRVSEPYKLASRRFRQQPSIVEGEWGAIGGPNPWIALEPVGIEVSGEDPPPSLPYAVLAGGRFDAAVTRAAVAPESIGSLSCLSLDPQSIGGRWPARFVAREAGTTVEEWLEAAERELVRGSGPIVLLETGGRYPDGTRTLDAIGIARARQATHLPIVVDVPRIADHKQLVPDVAYAAIGAGANGVILRTWVGAPGGNPRVPSTLGWDEAVSVADRIRAVGRALRG